MNYMGSKRRISKFILPIMLAERKPGQCWVEPFVGGGNMIDKVDGPRLGADVNKWAVDALLSIRDFVEELPKNNLEFTEDAYKKLRNSDDYRFKGFAGFAYSFGGKWLGGWERNSENKRDYVRESYKNAVKQSPKLQGVELVCKSYLDLEIPPNSLIYCDPPYENTTKYKESLNYIEFWNWCRQKSVEGFTVFISEYKAPSDFECVFEVKITSSFTKNTRGKFGVEKLFRYRGV